MATIKELMQWRFACKHFDTDKKISESDLNDLLDTTRMSPSSCGLQAWKFLVVENAESKKELQAACYNQPQIAEASVLVVFCADSNLEGENGVIERHIKKFTQILKTLPQQEESYRKMVAEMQEDQTPEEVVTWLNKQLYIASETLILAAAEKGIDSCPMEGFEPEQIHKILDLPANLHPALIVPLGYRKMTAPAKVRFPLEEVVIRMD